MELVATWVVALMDEVAGRHVADVLVVPSAEDSALLVDLGQESARLRGRHWRPQGALTVL